jgi:hypothetical protein
LNEVLGVGAVVRQNERSSKHRGAQLGKVGVKGRRSVSWQHARLREQATCRGVPPLESRSSGRTRFA